MSYRIKYTVRKDFESVAHWAVYGQSGMLIAGGFLTKAAAQQCAKRTTVETNKRLSNRSK